MKTNYWKTAMTVLFISGSLSGILFVSCQKEENSVTKSSEIKWEIKNKEHQKLIEDVSNYYEESILEALNERNSVLKSSSQSYYIENVIYNKFEEKCLKYNANLKSYNEQILSPDDLQHYMIDLSNKL